MTTTVSMQALTRRINRRLRKENEQLRRHRGRVFWTGWEMVEPGCYFRHETRRNLVIEWNVDPETLGRELGALNSWETVEEK